MKRKVFLALALFALMTVGVYAQTEADFTVQNSADGKSVTITGYKGSATAVNIPARINNLPVTTIYAAFTNNNKITSVTIPNGVTTIDMTAFAGTSITSIAIPNSITTIGEDTFSDCVKLASVIIPKSVTRIGVRAFDGCTSLTSVTFEGTPTINTTAFNGDLRAKYLDASGGIGTYTRPAGGTTWTKSTSAAAPAEADFTVQNSADGKSVTITGYKGSATAVNIPARINNLPVTTIYAAFTNNNKITSVTIPNGVTTIDMTAFAGTSITSIAIPNSITTIGEDTFSDCVKLASVIIPKSVTRIGVRAFDGCTSLTSVTFEGTPTINTTAFNGDLRAKYLAGGAGTYTRASGGTTWTKK